MNVDNVKIQCYLCPPGFRKCPALKEKIISHLPTRSLVIAELILKSLLLVYEALKTLASEFLTHTCSLLTKQVF